MPGRPVKTVMPVSLSRVPAVPLAGALGLAASVGIGRFAYTPLLPAMQETFAWTLSQAGDVASANFLGYMVGALAAATLAQRLTRRYWLCMGMFLSSITTTAGAVGIGVPLWVGLRFCSGVVSALCLVLSTAMVFEYLDRVHRRPLGALHFAGVGVGIVVSVVSTALGRYAGWAIGSQWAVLGGVAALLCLGAWRSLRALPEPRLAGRAGGYQATPGQLPSPRVLYKLITAYGLFGLSYIVTATFLVAMARRLEPATLLEPLTWIVVGVLAAPSVFVWQFLAQRLGMLPALRLAYGVESLGVLLAGCVPDPVAVLAGGALLGGTFMGITALGLSVARQYAGHHQERVVGWMTAAFGFGQFLGPAIAGRLAQMTQGFAVPSLCAALLLVVGIALLYDMETA